MVTFYQQSNLRLPSLVIRLWAFAIFHNQTINYRYLCDSFCSWPRNAEQKEKKSELESDLWLRTQCRTAKVKEIDFTWWSDSASITMSTTEAWWIIILRQAPIADCCGLGVDLKMTSIRDFLTSNFWTVSNETHHCRWSSQKFSNHDIICKSSHCSAFLPTFTHIPTHRITEWNMKRHTALSCCLRFVQMFFGTNSVFVPPFHILSFQMLKVKDSLVCSLRFASGCASLLFAGALQFVVNDFDCWFFGALGNWINQNVVRRRSWVIRINVKCLQAQVRLCWVWLKFIA